MAMIGAARAGDDLPDLTTNLLAGQAPFATGFWKEINMPGKSFRYGAHSNAGYTFRLLPEPEAPQQPSIGRALGYKCLGVDSFFVLYEEVSHPRTDQAGIYRKICSLRRITAGVMTYVDVPADEYGRCGKLKKYLEGDRKKGRSLLRRGEGEDSSEDRRTGTLVRLESPINSVETTCTVTDYVPPVMVPLSTAPYPLATDVTLCTDYVYTQTGGPANVQGLWVVGSKKSYVLESVTGAGSVTWDTTNDKPEKLSMNEGIYTASACPTVESTPGVVVSYTQSYFQRRYIDGTITASPPTTCRKKSRNFATGTLVVAGITGTPSSQFLVENLPGNPDLTCTAEAEDGDDDK